jgi:hypothetical protein
MITVHGSGFAAQCHGGNGIRAIREVQLKNVILSAQEELRSAEQSRDSVATLYEILFRNLQEKREALRLAELTKKQVDSLIAVNEKFILLIAEDQSYKEEIANILRTVSPNSLDIVGELSSHIRSSDLPARMKLRTLKIIESYTSISKSEAELVQDSLKVAIVAPTSGDSSLSERLISDVQTPLQEIWGNAVSQIEVLKASIQSDEIAFKNPDEVHQSALSRITIANSRITTANAELEKVASNGPWGAKSFCDRDGRKYAEN